MLPLIVPNNPIPPRSRARCFADSPRRGEYGSLGRRLRRGKQFDFDVITPFGREQRILFSC
jgi:hypothetical protein